MDLSITLDRMMMGCLDCGVVLISPRHGVTSLNKSAASFLSISNELPAPLDVLPAPVFAFVDRILKHPATMDSTEISLPSRNGADQVLLLKASPLAGGSPHPDILLTLQKVRTTEQLEGRLRHFERLARLGLLSASVAHELRNSLVALSTLADVLIEQQGNNEMAQTVRRELDRANKLAIRMLKFARPGTQLRKPVSTHEILDRALQLANSRFKEAGATITKSLQADPDLVSADETHLEQMFLNLLINAADAIHANGEVNLTTEIVQENKVGRAVRIAVRDSGTGIPPEVLPSLFQPFVTTKRHGTGLGLYLAHRIIDEHCGCINVDSVPGRGTCVQVYLPVHSH